MKLNAKTLSILKSYTGINPSLYFDQGNVLKTIAISKTILAKATLDQEFPVSFAIYDLPRFINVVGMFKEPELLFEENQVIIQSGKQKVKYTFADPKTVVKPEKEIKLPSVDVEFSLTQEAMKAVLQASSVLAVEYIAVVGDGTTLSLKSFDVKNPTSDLFIEEIGTTDKTFQATFKVENLKLLPRAYQVSICARGFAFFKADDIEYFVALESESSSFSN